MVGTVTLIEKERWRAINVENDEIEIAVIIDVAECSAAARLQRSRIQPCPSATSWNERPWIFRKSCNGSRNLASFSSTSVSDEKLPFAIRMSGQPSLSKSPKPVPHFTNVLVFCEKPISGANP